MQVLRRGEECLTDLEIDVPLCGLGTVLPTLLHVFHYYRCATSTYMHLRRGRGGVGRREV
jgi:hypothetical protein